MAAVARGIVVAEFRSVALQAGSAIAPILSICIPATMSSKLEPFERDNQLWRVDRRLMLRQEIDAAVGLFFEGNNIASRVLAWASLDVLRPLMDQAGLETFHGSLEDHIRTEFVALWRDLLRNHYNYFKHADRDPDRVIDDYRPVATAFHLLGAVADYRALYGTQTITMAILTAWFFARYPTVLNDEAPLRGKILEDLFKVQMTPALIAR